jgi:hypothetical protein
MIWISVAWLFLNLVVAVPLLETIYKHIKEKAVVQVTLVDLIYCDLIIWIFLISLVYTVAIGHCIVQLDANSALDDFYATLYSRIFEVILFFLSTSLILSGGLRLLSMVKRSEAAGLQLLGPDDTAIVITRCIYLVPSAVLELALALDGGLHSGLFDLLHSEDSSSISSRCFLQLRDSKVQLSGNFYSLYVTM